MDSSQGHSWPLPPHFCAAYRGGRKGGNREITPPPPPFPVFTQLQEMCMYACPSEEEEEEEEEGPPDAC